jgi:hypothetical protein
MRYVISLLGLSLTLFGLFATAPAADAPPNIVLILADDEC